MLFSFAQPQADSTSISADKFVWFSRESAPGTFHAMITGIPLSARPTVLVDAYAG